MADENLLTVLTAVQLAPIQEGMSGAAESVYDGTAQIVDRFEVMADSTAASTQEVNATMASLQLAIERLATVNSTMMAKIAVSTKEGATEAELSLAELREQAVKTAEGFGIVGAASGSAFGALGAALGVGLVAEYFDHLKEGELELKHLSEATGESVGNLAGWRAAITETGASAENFDKILPRLAKNMLAASDPASKQAADFKALGVSTESWAQQLPPVTDVLAQIADHLHETGAQTANLGLAQTILGRGSAQLTGFLSQGSEAIAEAVARYKDLADAAEANVKAASDLQAKETQFTANIKTALLPVMSFLIDAIELVVAGGIKWEAAFEILGRGMMVSIQGPLHAIQGMGTVIEDLWQRNGAKASQDAKAVLDGMKDDVALATVDMAAIWDDANKRANNVLTPPTETPAGKEAVETPEKGDQLAADRAQLEQMKSQRDAFHQLSLAEEVSFWQHVLQTQQLSVKDQGEVQKEINTLAHQLAMERYRDQIALEEELVGLTREGSQQRAEELQKELQTVKAHYEEGSKQVTDIERKLLENQVSMNAQQVQEMVRTAAQTADAMKQGSEERVQVYANLVQQLRAKEAEIQTAQTAAATAGNRAAVLIYQQSLDEIVKAVAAAGAKEIEAENKAVQERTRIQKEFGQEAIAEQKRQSDDAIALLSVQLGMEVTQRKLTESQKDAILQQELDKQYAMRVQSMRQEIAAAQGNPFYDPVALQKLEDQLADIQRQHQLAVSKTVADGMKSDEQRFNQFFTGVNSGMMTLTNQMLRGQVTIGAGFARLGVQMEMAMIQALEKMVLKWVEQHLFMMITHQTWLAQLLGLDAANNAAKTAQSAAAADASVTQQAGIAGAAAFASVMASLPFPENIAAAPGAMAAAISATLGNLSLASAAGGMEVPNDMLAMVHKNEMVLPAGISSGLKTAIGAQPGGQKAAMQANPEQHIHMNVHAVDRQGVQRLFKNNSGEMMRTIKKAARHGK